MPPDQVSTVRAERHGHELRPGPEVEVLGPVVRVDDLEVELPVSRHPGRGDPPAVGRPGDAEDDRRLIWDDGDHAPGLRVPDRGGRFEAARYDQPVAGRADRQTPDFVRVVRE